MTKHMTCDADCTRAGWVEALAYAGETELHISFPADADTDSRFLAFNHDEQEMVWINGWMVEFDVVGTPCGPDHPYKLECDNTENA